MNNSLRLLTAIVLTSLCIACGPGKVTRENYDKIHEGMTKPDVEAILGQPTEVRLVAVINDKEVKGSIWRGRDISIGISYTENGKVMLKTDEVAK